MKSYKWFFMILILVFWGCTRTQSQEMPDSAIQENLAKATFAGGCYWCMEAAFEKLDGPVDVISGYAEGEGADGKVEAIQVTYNARVISYPELLDYYWRQFDPTDEGGSFHDRGPEYESYIFYHTDRQQALAKKSKQNLDRAGIFEKPLVTRIVKFSKFIPVEESEQDFYRKNPERYHSYRQASGRDAFLKKYWGTLSPKQYQRPADDDIRNQLTELQFRVTRQNGTEPAFHNEYNANEKTGIYVDLVSGEPLFSSTHKYESGTGWPSFTRPLDPRYISRKIDQSLVFETRVEIRSKMGNSHLGHVFTDGPAPTHLRYCMNSAAFRFIPKEDMDAAGYGHLMWLFKLD